MVYDNSKLKIAMQNWLDTCCHVGFGEESAGNLLASFEAHLARTADLKRSPGRVVFGQQLKQFGMDQRKVAGLSYWSGLALIDPPAKPVKTQYKKTEQALEKRVADKQSALESEAEKKVREKQKALLKFKKEIVKETAESVRAVGGELPDNTELPDND